MSKEKPFYPTSSCLCRAFLFKVSYLDHIRKLMAAYK